MNWESIQASVSNAWDQFLAVGVPAIQVGLQNEAQQWLAQQQQTAQAQLDQGVAQLVQGPSSAFGSGVASGVTSGLLKEYGPMIMAGFVVVLGVGYFIARGK